MAKKNNKKNNPDTSGSRNVPDKIKGIYNSLSPASKKRLAATIANMSQLKGKDRAYAIATTFSSILSDGGKLDSVISRDEFNDIIGTFDLASNWDKTSDINKFVQGGRQIVKLANKYGDTEIPYANDALGLASLGYSQYQLINNWDKLDDKQKLVAISQTYSNVASAYNTVAGVSAAAGATGAAAGIGTSTAAVGGASAAGAGAAGAGAGAAGASTGSSIAGGAALASGYVAAAYGAYQMYENFGTGGNDGRKTGAAAGAAAGAVIGSVVPVVGTIIGAAVGMAIGSIKTGKSVEQGARDSYRGWFEEMGVLNQYKDVKDKEGLSIRNTDAGDPFDSMSMLELADGSFYQVGVDGSDSRATFQGENKTVSDASKLLEKDKGGLAGGGELRPYEIDYTNDLDYFADNSLTALKFIMGGGAEQMDKSGEFNQMFGLLGNASTSNAGSREFNQENFDSTMSNIRNIYAKAGITNSDQAYNMLTQLQNEGKITQEQFNMAGASLRISFNNDFDYANQLNETRFDGLSTVGTTDNFVQGGEPLPSDDDVVNSEATAGAVKPDEQVPVQEPAIQEPAVTQDTENQDFIAQDNAPIEKPTGEQDFQITPIDRGNEDIFKEQETSFQYSAPVTTGDKVNESLSLLGDLQR